MYSVCKRFSAGQIQTLPNNNIKHVPKLPQLVFVKNKTFSQKGNFGVSFLRNTCSSNSKGVILNLKKAHVHFLLIVSRNLYSHIVRQIYTLYLRLYLSTTFYVLQSKRGIPTMQPNIILFYHHIYLAMTLQTPRLIFSRIPAQWISLSHVDKMWDIFLLNKLVSILEKKVQWQRDSPQNFILSHNFIIQKYGLEGVIENWNEYVVMISDLAILQ